MITPILIFQLILVATHRHTIRLQTCLLMRICTMTLALPIISPMRVSNLNLSTEEYTSLDQIRVGNGTSLSISHIDSATLSVSRRKFILKQLLHVLYLCKNLLSVSKFAHDNNVFFLFHSSYFVIKDCGTEIPLIAAHLTMIFINWIPLLLPLQ